MSTVQRKKTLISIIISLFIFLILFELGSFIIVKNDLLKSKDSKVRDAIYYSFKRPHPYLGYIESNSNFMNEFGAKQDNKVFNVGIFGGSVAAQFCEYENKYKILQIKFGKRSKRIKVTCFALGGGRQPQQLIAYLLYGDSMDYSIFIEGSNEMEALSRVSKSVEYPLTRLSAAWYKGFESFFYERLQVFLNSKLLLWSKTESNFNSIEMIKFITGKIANHYGLNRYQKYKSDKSVSEAQLAKLQDVWKQSLRKIDKISLLGRRDVLVVIQPFLMFKEKKTQEEKTFLGSSDSIDKRKKVLAKISNDFKKIKFDNVKLIDYSNYFENVSEQRFIDDVHLNESGLRALWSRLISQILQASSLGS